MIFNFRFKMSKDKKIALKRTKNFPLWVAEHPFGLDELVQGFQSVVGDDEVKIKGIVGMGGSGI